jgi:polar amino acid transport system substrate-binding protein
MRRTGFSGFLYMAIAAVWTLCAGASAEPLRLVAGHMLPFQNLDDEKAPGFSIEVLRQVFAAMNQDASFESFSWERGWWMMRRGERDGMVTVLHTADRERICAFPDEPLKHESWVLFARTADIATSKFSSFNDLIGHEVAVHAPVPGVLEQPTVSPELWKLLLEHRNMVETSGATESIRMLAAGRVDYAVVNLTVGKRDAALIGLSEKIQPILSRSVMEDGFSVCFNKARVSPSLVEAFSRALKEFKQTEAFQAIYRKYFP